MIHGLDLDDHKAPPFARLVSTGLPIDKGQVHKVWRGLVQVPGSTEPAIPVALKWMSGQSKLPIELACSLAAAQLGLPVPRGVVVLSSRDQLPGLPAAVKPLPGSDDVICYGGMHQWPDDSAARLLDEDGAAEYTWRQLCQSASAAPGAAWDELTANPDRHVNNLLFDGLRYWFIDHEQALEPMAQMMRRWAATVVRQAVLEHQAKVNAVATQLVRRRPRDHEILGQPSHFNRAARRIELLADAVRGWSSGHKHVDDVWPLTEVVLRGISLRLPALADMLTRRLQIPLPRSLWNS